MVAHQGTPKAKTSYFCPPSLVHGLGHHLAAFVELKLGRYVDLALLRVASSPPNSITGGGAHLLHPGTLSFIDLPEAKEGKIPRCFPDTNNTQLVISALSAAPLTYSH